jgi:hypothetical protein
MGTPQDTRGALPFVATGLDPVANPAAPGFDRASRHQHVAAFLQQGGSAGTSRALLPLPAPYLGTSYPHRVETKALHSATPTTRCTTRRATRNLRMNFRLHERKLLARLSQPAKQ